MTRQPADPWRRLESPRAIAVVVVITATLAGLAGYDLGYQLGSRPPPAPTIVFQPGSIVVTPAPAPAR